jgi:hypothetical protein
MLPFVPWNLTNAIFGVEAEFHRPSGTRRPHQATRLKCRAILAKSLRDSDCRPHSINPPGYLSSAGADKLHLRGKGKVKNSSRCNIYGSHAG